MKQLGMPRYCGSGSHTYRGEKYRFLVLPRFGNDLHKVFEKHGRRFHLRTALALGIQIVSKWTMNVNDLSFITISP